MTQAISIMPCLDMQNGRVVKGVHFVDIRDAGDPVECAQAYCKAGADELALLVETLSAPASSTAAADATSEIPPPTVKGTEVASATRFTTSSMVPRPSTVAVMSSSASSSAPALQ